MLKNSLFSLGLMAGLTSDYVYNPEYENLTDEEKECLDYQNECLSNPDEKFSDACFHIMIFILDVTSKLGTPEEPNYEEIQEMKNKILQDFTDSDKERLETFMYACVITQGIYSEERVKERKLKKMKGND